MKTKLLTDQELRSVWSRERGGSYTVEPGTMLTPAARDFLHEHAIELRFESAAPWKPMPRAEVPRQDGKPVFTEAATGRTLTEKPEELTHLHGNVLVPKTHPRIALRGRLDSLSAEFLETEALADERGEGRLAEQLEELRSAVLALIRCEVLDEPVRQTPLLGLSSGEIRRRSHEVKETLGIDHPMPDYHMGRLTVALNTLRTQVRETELAAAAAFEENGVCTRPDAIERLNRLSSCVYILYCRRVAGQNGGGK